MRGLLCFTLVDERKVCVNPKHIVRFLALANGHFEMTLSTGEKFVLCSTCNNYVEGLAR